MKFSESYRNQPSEAFFLHIRKHIIKEKQTFITVCAQSSCISQMQVTPAVRMPGDIVSVSMFLQT